MDKYIWGAKIGLFEGLQVKKYKLKKETKLFYWLYESADLFNFFSKIDKTIAFKTKQEALKNLEKKLSFEIDKLLVKIDKNKSFIQECKNYLKESK